MGGVCNLTTKLCTHTHDVPIRSEFQKSNNKLAQEDRNFMVMESFIKILSFYGKYITTKS